jgi:hypothetical protein
MLSLLLSQLPDKLLLLWSKKLFEFCKSKFSVLSLAATTVKVCPVIITQVVSTREGG